MKKLLLIAKIVVGAAPLVVSQLYGGEARKSCEQNLRTSN